MNSSHPKNWFAFCIAIFAIPSLICLMSFNPVLAQTLDENTDGANKDGVTQAGPSFKNDIEPILAARCYECHNDDNAEHDINYQSWDSWKKTVVPGDSSKSELYEVLISEDELMPPEDSEKPGPLPAEQISLIKSWIDAGADMEDKTLTPNEEYDPSKESLGLRIWKFVGVFHPAMTHFPVALLMISAFFIIFCGRNQAISNDAAFYCLLFGTLGAIVASATGWSYAPLEGRNAGIDDFGAPETRHRWLGIATALFGLVFTIVAWRQRSQAYSDGGGSWKFGVVILAIMVSIVGYQGGELTYGEDHYTKPLKKFLPEADQQINEWTSQIFGEPADEGNNETKEGQDSQDTQNESGEGDKNVSDKAGSGDMKSDDSKSDDKGADDKGADDKGSDDKGSDEKGGDDKKASSDQDKDSANVEAPNTDIKSDDKTSDETKSDDKGGDEKSAVDKKSGDEKSDKS